MTYYELNEMKSSKQKLKYLPYGQAYYTVLVYDEINDNDEIVNQLNQYILTSYYTDVATVEYTTGDGFLMLKCDGTYSSTTRKHLNRFAKEISKITGIKISYYDFKESYLQDKELIRI